jgi:hypothetical protein
MFLFTRINEYKCIGFEKMQDLLLQDDRRLEDKNRYGFC